MGGGAREPDGRPWWVGMGGRVVRRGVPSKACRREPSARFVSRSSFGDGGLGLQTREVPRRKEPARYGVREIKWVATLEVAKLQKQADDLSKSIRELNALIQEANW